MRRFARLFRELDQTTKTNRKVDILSRYFNEVSDEDKIWTIALLTNKKPKRTVKAASLREWAAGMAGLPVWLFDESYRIVGDLAESIALMLPPPEGESNRSLSDWVIFILSQSKNADDVKRENIQGAWKKMDYYERFVFNKLITGGFRIGVSQKLLVRALSKHTEIDENTLAHKLTGQWDPKKIAFKELILDNSPFDQISKPYPFYLTYPIETITDLGNPREWFAERKWDGIRGQFIKREGHLFLWSRGNELITDQFPELSILRTLLQDGTVFDGEILSYKDKKPLGFQYLQKRLGRKNVSRKLIKEVPIIFKAFDVLEHQGKDIRNWPLKDRRLILQELILKVGLYDSLQLSDLISFDSWDDLDKERQSSRIYKCEGIMLKRKDSAYKIGRCRGEWWKWKTDPLTIDAIVLYAEQGHGRRANLFTDYTLAVWNENKLIPFTKAYSGLTDAEFQEVTRFVKDNTLERFGPVRAIRPSLVFEIAFEGIQKSNRHKSGVALRFPRIRRWRKDKHPKEANSLEDLKKILTQYGV
jgi:DNA ligase-1